MQRAFRGGNRSSLPYASMAKSWMRAGQLAFPEIPPTCIAGDTRGFGKDGCGHKRQDGILGGMLGVVRGTKLLGIWSKSPLMQHFGNTEAMCSRHYNQQASLNDANRLNGSHF